MPKNASLLIVCTFIVVLCNGFSPEKLKRSREDAHKSTPTDSANLNSTNLFPMQSSPTDEYKSETFTLTNSMTSVLQRDKWESSTTASLPTLAHDIFTVSTPDSVNMSIDYGPDMMVPCPMVLNVNVSMVDDTNSRVMVSWKLPDDPHGVITSICVSTVAIEGTDKVACTLEESCHENLFEENVLLELCNSHAYNISVFLQCGNTTGKESTSYLEGKAGVPGPPQVRVEDYTNSSVTLKWTVPEAHDVLQYTISWNSTPGYMHDNTTGTEYTVSNLLPYTPYNFTVSAWNTEGEGKSSLPLVQRTDVGVPDAPQNVTVIAVDPNTLLLTWTRPAVARGPINGYDLLYRVTNPKQNWTTHTAEPHASSTVIDGLKPHTEYAIRISSFNNDKKEKKLKSEIVKLKSYTPESIPGAPENVTVFNATDTTLSVSWLEPLEPNGEIKDYLLTYNISANSTISKSTTQKEILVDDLEAYTLYRISVAASTVAGYGFPSHILAKTDVGVPSAPEDLEAQEIAATKVLVSWSKPSVSHGAIDGYLASCYEASEHGDTNQSVITSNTSYYFTDLKPWTEYKFTVEAFNVDLYHRNLFGKPAVLEARTQSAVPSPPRDVYALVESSRSVLVGWSYDGIFPGPMNFSVQVWKKAGPCIRTPPHIVFNHSVDLCSWTVNSTVVNNLEPYTLYAFRVEARTETGGSVSLLSRPVTTEPDVPGPPQSFSADCTKHSTSVLLSWRTPKLTNGLIAEYCVSYFSENHQPSQKSLPISLMLPCRQLNYTMIVDDLQPEIKYNFSVKAKTHGIDQYGTEVFLPDYCILPAGVPPFPENTTRWTAESSSDQEVVVSWPKKMFSSVLGRIVSYSLIVAWPDKIGKPEQGIIPLEKPMPAWADFWCDSSDIYQATPEKWNPVDLEEERHDPLNCRTTSDVEGDLVHCTLGCEKNCSEDVNMYCNGPLKPGKQYGIKIRAFTAAGYSESHPLLVTTKFPDASFSLGLTLGLTLSILAILSAVAAYLIMRKNKILPFPNLTVLFQKAVENQESSVIVGSCTNGTLPRSIYPRPLNFSTFLEHVKTMMSDSALKFSIEYEELKKHSPRHPCTAAEMEENKPKNRWMNIFPFDHSRVKLLPIDDEPGSDYINASYIPGFSSHREYIASQGPLAHTVDDFWRMIWEQKISVIVMLAQCIERGKKKCEQYWPLEAGEYVYYGDLKVKMIAESVCSEYTKRILEVVLGSRNRKIIHMHFTRWPDFGCPESPDELISFVKAVRSQHSHDASIPILVHCSAGVGRTGTFIAVDRLLQHIEHHNYLDVYSTVREMRDYRVNMVQTEDQYIYIHKCMQEIILEKMSYKISFSSADEEISSNAKETSAVESRLLHAKTINEDDD